MAVTAELGQLNIPIRATLDQLDKDLAGARSKVEGALKGVQDLGKLALGGLAAGVAAVGGALATIGPAAVGAASDLSESMSKANVVFGDSIKAVDSFAATSAASFGIAKQTAYEATGTFGNLFVTMGLGKKQASNMSVDVVKLAADLASFNNLNPEEVLDKLRAGLVGETEPLRSLGVNLTADAIEAKAMAMGLAKTTSKTVIAADAAEKLSIAQAKHGEVLKKYGANSLQARESAMRLASAEAAVKGKVVSSTEELTPAMKAQAAYALIMEQTKTAQGDFARTSDGLANTQRILQATFKDISTEIGGALLPLVLGMAQSVQPIVNELMPKLRDILKQVEPAAKLVGDSLSVFVGSLIAGMDPLDAFRALLFKLLPSDIYNALMDIVGGVRDFISSIQPIIDQVTAWIGQNVTLQDVLMGLGAAIATVVVPAIISIVATAAPIVAAFIAVVAVAALLRQAWTENWGGIRDTLTAFWEGTAKPALEALRGWLSVNVPAAIQTLSNFWNNTLLPALNAVWSFLNTYVIPGWTAVANLLTAVVGKAVEALAGLWKNVLQPALQSLVDFHNRTFGPIFKELGENMLPKVSKAFSDIGSIIKVAIDKFNELAGSIRGLTLPKWLQPGSPTPLELGLAGIAGAADRASDSIGSMLATRAQLGAGGSVSASLAMTPETVGRGAGGSADTYNQQQTSVSINVQDELASEYIMDQARRGRLGRLGYAM